MMLLMQKDSTQYGPFNSVEIQISYIPFQSTSGSDYITLGPPADNSGIPSRIDMSIGDANSLISYSANLRKAVNPYFGGNMSSWIVGIETNLLLHMVQDIPMVILGNFGYGTGFDNFSFDALVHLGFITGSIGEVGNRDGDVWLVASDGESYSTGADITMSKFIYGASAKVNYNIALTEKHSISLAVGYKFFPKIDNFDFTVSEGDRSSDLDKSGIQGNQPIIEMGGFLAQIRFLIF